jgi:hypothetical protein
MKPSKYDLLHAARERIAIRLAEMPEAIARQYLPGFAQLDAMCEREVTLLPRAWAIAPLSMAVGQVQP